MNINIYKEPGDVISVDDACTNEPILWCRNGEYRIIPIPVIKNAANTLSMCMASDGKRTQPVPVIIWSQGVPISNLAGRALTGE